MPRTTGMTAMSGWMVAMIAFVFFALASYAYLLWLLKPSFLKKNCSKYNHSGNGNGNGRMRRFSVIAKRVDGKEVQVHDDDDDDDDDDEEKERLNQSKMDEERNRRHRTKVDDICLLTFPLVFLLFNFTYWTICSRNRPSLEQSEESMNVTDD